MLAQEMNIKMGLRNKDSLKPTLEFEFRKLTINDLKDILTIQENVVKEVGENRFAPVLEEEVLNRLSENSSTGAYHNQKLAGVLVDFLDPSMLPLYSEKTGINLDTKDGYRQYFYIVEPEYRGYSLTDKLLELSLAHEKKHGTKHSLATVAVDNYASIKILLNAGQEFRYVGPVYGEKIRFISYQDLSQTRQNRIPELWIDSNNLEEQQSLFSRGYKGFQVKKEGDTILIGYSKY